MSDPHEIEAPSPLPKPAPVTAEGLRLRGDPPLVMRLSRKSLAIVGLVASIGVGGSLIYALRPAHQAAAVELFNTDGRAQADSVTGAPKDYGQIPKLGPPLPGDLGRPIVSAEQRGADVPLPPMGARPAPSAIIPAAQAAQASRQRVAQERDSARTSKLFLGAGAPGGGDAGSATPMPGLLASAVPASGNAGAAATPTAPSDDVGENGQAAKRAFLAAPTGRSPVSVDRLAPPPSPYVVQAGSVIAAALITGIRSDLPGQITAQVTQNVYDSPTGRILLIPQGSKLIGEYDSQISFGQNRVLLAWDRLILPDGQSIALDRQPGADASGFAGLQDRTNYHWGDMAKATLLSTLLGVGAEVGSNSNDELTQAIRRGTSDTVNQTGQQIVRRQLNVQPTLTIRPGYPVRVIVTKDLVFSPIPQGRR